MIYTGDCLEILPTLEADSIDSIVTDPPYGLKFMGKSWDHGVPGVPFWEAALRVAKPGAFMLAFGGTRTFHRLAVAIEDAGWEIRDTVMWVYGSGFPKSLDVSKAIDKAAGIWRGKAGAVTRNNAAMSGPNYKRTEKGAPETAAAAAAAGWGTALKPAWEPIIVARKPIVGTVADNVLKFGTGAMNIDGCRVGEGGQSEWVTTRGMGFSGGLDHGPCESREAVKGRWPANLIHDGSDEVMGLFPHSTSGAMLKPYAYTNTGFSLGAPAGETRQIHESNEGNAARFFYCAKASKQDRDEGLDGPETLCGMMEDDNYPIKTGSGNLRETKRRNNHPTVKPLALMRYLCRLVTPPGGTILDPFMGSGSTGKAAIQEGFEFVGIELNQSYAEIAERRIEAVSLPLFGGGA